MSNLLDAEPQNRLRQLDGKDDPKPLQANPRDQKRHSLLPMWILVAPPDQQHLHVTNCCGNVSDELTEDLFETSYPHVPAARIDLYHTKFKKRTRCWNGDKISSSKKVNASVSGKLSWVCMVCRRQPKRFLRQLRLGTLLASCKQFSQMGLLGSSQFFFRSSAKVCFLESLALEATR